MSNSRVTRFNVICGNAPHMGTDYEYWKQIKNQAKRVLEEAQELYDNAEAENMLGVLDGWADVKYTNEYMEDLLVAGEVNTKKAWDAVCDNNDQKFTTSYTYAKESKDLLESNGVECYIDSITYEGTLYFAVKDIAENKVRKLLHHESPDIAKYVSQEFK